MRISGIVSLLVFVTAAMPAFGQVAPSKLEKKTVGLSWQSQAQSGWQLDLGPSGTWWRNQRYVTMLSLTPDQQKKMDEVFQQSRVKLIDLKATLDKEEAILEPLMKAERLDEPRVALQIDKVADARAELEKANARMLLGIRQLLTPDQWATLGSMNSKLLIKTAR
jgi:Spy/CpxP family protein refolding chaperone